MHSIAICGSTMIGYWQTYFEKGVAEGPAGDENVLKRNDMVPEKMPSMRTISSPVLTSELSVLIIGCGGENRVVSSIAI